MDSSKENSIAKWGTMGSSNHRSVRGSAIGGKPPYLKVNGTNLTEVEGGEVVATNLASCNAPPFVLDLCLKKTNELQGHTGSGLNRTGVVDSANARISCFYFPILQGKESIDTILEKLDKEGSGVGESFETFCRVSIRRLGRLLPDARWVNGNPSNMMSLEANICVEASEKVGVWKLCPQLSNTKCVDIKQLKVRLGSEIGPLYIACYDVFSNRMPFKTYPQPQIEVRRMGKPLGIKIEKARGSLTQDRMHLQISVDDQGCVNFGGLLKVTGHYGSKGRKLL